MKKIIALAACIMIFAGTAFSQNYKHAVGLRVGSGVGITYKQNLGKGAFEGIAWLNFGRNGGFNVTGLYEWRTKVINPDFNLYYGVGGHIGVYSKDFAFGIDGIVGLEYKIPGAPIALSIDYKPALNFIPSVHFDYYNLGLGVKFTF